MKEVCTVDSPDKEWLLEKHQFITQILIVWH